MQIFSRPRLMAFLTCQRRFQLRYVAQLPWPAAPQSQSQQEATYRGQLFHQLLERHFLGLNEPEKADIPQLRQWWATFERHGPSLPAGTRLPEISLTVPVGRHLLTGRFDLLVLAEGEAHIFDWKTEARPRPEWALRSDWQTILYLALLVEGGVALQNRPILPDQVRLTYWFANDPAASVTIDYGPGQHQANWRQITDLIAQIDRQISNDQAWPMTDDWAECGRCAFQLYCGRQIIAPPAGEPTESDDPLPDFLEPPRP